MTDTTVENMQTTSGVTLSGTDTQTVNAGGASYNATLHDTSQQIASGGLVYGSNLYDGSVQTLTMHGSASATTIYGGQQIVDGSIVIGQSDTYATASQAYYTTLDGGTQALNGGISYDTVLNSGAQQLVNNGTADNTYINSGGIQIITGGQVTNTMINAGGLQIVNVPQSSLHQSQTSPTNDNVSNTIVASGGTQLLLEPYATNETQLLPGGTIDVRYADLTGGNISFNSPNGFLLITGGNQSFGTVLNGDYSDEHFVLTADGLGGTNITVEPLCFCRGTMIRTDDGDTAVERLRAGDVVQTSRGARPICWIGSSTGLVHPDNRPVLIRPGALGENVPTRALRVTRWHSLLFGDVLIPIGELVNDVSIVWDSEMRTLEVFHIELDHHAILYAEGAEAESYRDDGNRTSFDTSMRPATAARSMPTVAPVVKHGPIVQRTKQRLAERAKRLFAFSDHQPLAA